MSVTGHEHDLWVISGWDDKGWKDGWRSPRFDSPGEATAELTNRLESRLKKGVIDYVE